LLDLYLVDKWLPKQSGVDLCRQIRQFDVNTPIIFMSAAILECNRLEAIQAGAQTYLTKPVGLGTLLRTVSTAIDRAYLRSLQATRLGIAAIQEYMKESTPAGFAHCVASLDGGYAGTGAAHARANQGLLRVRAYEAFTAEGGTRANFERMWPSVLKEGLEG